MKNGLPKAQKSAFLSILDKRIVDLLRVSDMSKTPVLRHLTIILCNHIALTTFQP